MVIPHASSYAQAQSRRAVRALVSHRLFTAVNADSGLRRLESPAFQDTVRLAHESSHNAPDRRIGGALAIGQSVISMSGFVLTLLVINPVLVVVLFLASLPSVWIQLGLSRDRAQTMWDISPAMPRQVFYGELLTRPEAAKEVRPFGLGGFLRSRMLDEIRSTNEAERRVDLKTLRRQGLLALVWCGPSCRPGPVPSHPVT
ncbi:MAG: hypothetical protein ACRDNL_12285 [Spirillospora sp.]